MISASLLIVNLASILFIFICVLCYVEPSTPDAAKTSVKAEMM